GCDSIVTLHLSLINTVTHSLNANICQGDTFNFNGALLTATGIYYDTLSALTNCDSVVIMHLNAHELNASITLNGNTFTATGTGIIQWINCDSGTFVVDAIGNTFTPTVIGNYAAWVWDGLCDDTTECIFNGLTGMNAELSTVNSFVVFPNPTDESITIQFSKSCENCKLEITNTIGQIEFSAPINQKSEIINLKSFSSGIYFLKVINENGSIQVKKIIKQ
ncbi:MAG: T9SS type A sorting domain-containing protein, partial [Bacteroidota bacterium]